MQIDGRKINQEIGEDLKKKNQILGINPSLGILCVGDDPASLSFINVKKKFGETYGFSVTCIKLEEAVSVEEIKETIKTTQKNTDGIIVQLPLPKKFSEDETWKVLQEIDPQKDVDDLATGNFQAPIVLALQKIMQSINDVDFKKLKFGIVGLGQVVGLPIKNYLEENGFNLEIIKQGEFEKIKDCDVVISGVGSPKLITKEFIKQGSILIDYGCSYVDGIAHGDFDESCYEIAKCYTPVPGCMGPLVVASLFQNVFKAYTRVQDAR